MYPAQERSRYAGRYSFMNVLDDNLLNRLPHAVARGERGLQSWERFNLLGFLRDERLFGVKHCLRSCEPSTDVEQGTVACASEGKR